jgi:cobalamin biosynthesis Mg chelatase CobN
LDSFIEREKELGRDDLVFPILYVSVPELDDSRKDTDQVLSIISERQYIDWRQIRHQNVASTEVKVTVEQFCRSIAGKLRVPWISPEERRVIEEQKRAEDDRRRQEDEAKRKAEEEERQKVAEAKKRAEEERYRKKAERLEQSRREEQERSERERQAREQERQRRAEAKREDAQAMQKVSSGTATPQQELSSPPLVGVIVAGIFVGLLFLSIIFLLVYGMLFAR